MNTLNALESQMNAIISQFGQQACIDHAKKVYSASFRSEAVRICDHLNAFCDTQEEYYSEYNNLVFDIWAEIKNELYTKATGQNKPELNIIEDSYYDYEDEDPYGFGFCGCDTMYDSMAIDFQYELKAWNKDRDSWIQSQGLNMNDFINEQTEIVFLCNYKGEGEGEVLPFNSETIKLPVFKSKRDSFNAF